MLQNVTIQFLLKRDFLSVESYYMLNRSAGQVANFAGK